MKIITCASYYSCGSSAVTDMVSEFQDVKSLTEYEFRFIHDIDGISDLEHHLVECPNRHNSGHALKRFAKLSKFNAGTWFNSRYEPFFRNQYWTLTKSYIKKLSPFTYKSFWFYDMYDRGTKKYYWYSILNKLYAKIPLKIFEPLPNEFQYCPILDEESFLLHTRDYIKNLMDVANIEQSSFLMVDQILPSSNIARCMRYFEYPIYAFVVDRDPRDIYISAKTVYKTEHIVPHGVEAFCKWYRFARDCAKKETYDKNCVIRIQFEDMIFKYEEIRLKILKIVGLKQSQHVNQFAKFNPKRSVVNTQTWKKFPELAADIKIIENNLPEYLYDFESVRNNEIVGPIPNSSIMF